MTFTSWRGSVGVIKPTMRPGSLEELIRLLPDGIGEINDLFSRYFQDAGFEVLAMEGIDVPFTEVQRLSSQEVYAHTKRAFLQHDDADAIYMLGSGWRVMDIIAVLEQDLEVPVIHPVPARAWEIMKRLHVREPVSGYGRLLEILP